MRRHALNVAAAVAALLGTLLLAAPIAGVHPVVITGRSMGDALPLGSLAFARDARAAEVTSGQIVTFRPPGAARDVTHRVVGSDAHGLRTRGDANRAADPWRQAPTAEVRVVVTHLPVAGHAVAALRRPATLIAIGALLLLLTLLRAPRRPRRHLEATPA